MTNKNDKYCNFARNIMVNNNNMYRNFSLCCIFAIFTFNRFIINNANYCMLWAYCIYNNFAYNN